MKQRYANFYNSFISLSDCCLPDDTIKYGAFALLQHNDLRKKHGSAPLDIDVDLSEIAEDWARKRIQGKVEGHSKNKYKGQGLGENIWWGGASCSNWDMKDAVNSW